MSEGFFGRLSCYEGFTLPELRDLAIEKAKDRIASGVGEGDPRDFIRKRKRAFHRAYDGGYLHPDVIKFIANIATRNMINGLAQTFYSREIYEELLKPPSGLLSWLPE